jgi:uncharacterized protein
LFLGNYPHCLNVYKANIKTLTLYPMTIAKSWLAFMLPLLFTLGSVSPSLAVEKQLLRTLSVSGRGVTSIPATLTQVRLAVEVSGKSSNAVQQEAAQRSTKVIQFLRSRKVDKLQTAGISLLPVYNYSNNQQQLTGYNATNSLSFRLPVAQAGAVIDEAVKAGATRIDNVSSVASEEAIIMAQTQSLQLATKDAQRQAQAVLSALGFQSKEIIGIQINDAVRPNPVMMESASLTRGKIAQTEVVGGEQEVQSNVTLQISY